MSGQQQIFANCEKNLERQKLEEEFEKSAIVFLNNQKLLKIESFSGYYEFLSNNFFSPVYFDGILYPTVSHAFQASRSNDETTKKAILNAENLYIVGKIAMRIEDPPDWNVKKIKIMEKLLRDKFRRSKVLIEKLKATNPREIIMTYEEETPVNLFWGTVKSKGQNQLGRLLMKIRNDIIENNEIINWISNCFDLVTDENFIPDINLIVNKNGQNIDNILLKKKPFILMGILPQNDLKLDHPSISRFHSAIICDKTFGIILVDLRSKSGTYLDGDLINDHIPYRIKNGKKIKFAMSTREYMVEIDKSKIEKIYNKEKEQILSQNNLIDNLNNNHLKNSIKIEKNFENYYKTESLNHNIFVNNIPFETSDFDVVKLFEDKFGKIKNFKIPVFKGSGNKKGFAFIQFYEYDSAREAVDNGFICLKEKDNVFLKIKFANPKPDWENYNLKRNINKNYNEKRKRSGSLIKKEKNQKSSKKNKRKYSSRSRSKSYEKKYYKSKENSKYRKKNNTDSSSCNNYSSSSESSSSENSSSH